jgi:hypothetical protein
MQPIEQTNKQTNSGDLLGRGVEIVVPGNLTGQAPQKHSFGFDKVGAPQTRWLCRGGARVQAASTVQTGLSAAAKRCTEIRASVLPP